MYRVEEYDATEYVVWAGPNYLGSISMTSNGFYEYVDKLNRKLFLSDPWYIVSILERKQNERRE